MTRNKQNSRIKRMLAIATICALSFTFVMGSCLAVNAELADIYDDKLYEEEDAISPEDEPARYVEGDVVLNGPENVGVSSVSITSQPQNANVGYPTGCYFEVGVNKPEDVKSYQWYLLDKGRYYLLDGASAKTNRLELTATTQQSNGESYLCQITDNNDNVVVSDAATLTVNNAKENITVLYVMGYGLTAGQTLDVSTCKDANGKGIGTGTVKFDANGEDITFTNLNLNNTYMNTDHSLISGPGIVLDRYLNLQSEYRFHLVGTNKITNTYFEEDKNQAGISFDICCYGFDWEGDRVDPEITIEGAGSLDITGGTYAFRKFMGNLHIKSDITTHTYNNRYGKGIVSEYHGLYIEPGVKLNLETSSTGIASYYYLEMKGVDVNIVTEAAKVSVGATSYHGISASRGSLFDACRINIDFHASREIFSMKEGYPVTSAVGINCGSSDPRESVTSVIKNSIVSISLKTDDPVDEDYFANSFDGIYSTILNNLLIDSSDIDIDIESEALNNCKGIHSESNANKGNSLTIKDSEIDINCDVHYGPYGIYGHVVNIKDSKINSKIQTEYNIFQLMPIGIFAMDALNVDLSQKDNVIYSYAKNGTAVACRLPDSDVAASFDPKYQATKINLSNTTLVETPKKSAISAISYSKGKYKTKKEKEFGVLETFFSLNDTTKTADTVKLVSNYVSPDTGDNASLYLYMALLCGAGIASVGVALIRRKSIRG